MLDIVEQFENMKKLKKRLNGLKLYIKFRKKKLIMPNCIKSSSKTLLKTTYNLMLEYSRTVQTYKKTYKLFNTSKLP